jgi:hypothetical protein
MATGVRRVNSASLLKPINKYKKRSGSGKYQLCISGLRVGVASFTRMRVRDEVQCLGEVGVCLGSRRVASASR